MEGTLIDLIDRLGEVDQSDRVEPPCLYAVGGKFAKTSARACVAPINDGETVCQHDSALDYILTVQQALRAIVVWEQWFGRVPNRIQKFEAVMYYAQHDAFFPLPDS
jgi:hypothetical protein